MEYGYVRVSTREQNEQRQMIAMKEYGVEEARIYTDKQSGKDFARKNYKRLLRRLKSGDTLVIKSIDRLGGITRRSSSNGDASPKKSRLPLLCWICLFWIRARHGISPGR